MIKNSPTVSSLVKQMAAILRAHIGVAEPTAAGGDLVSLVRAYWQVHNLIDAPEDGPRTRRHPLNRAQHIDLEHISLTLYRQIMALTGLSFYPSWQLCISAVRIEAEGCAITSEFALAEIERLKRYVVDLGFKEQIVAERWMIEEGATA